MARRSDPLSFCTAELDALEADGLRRRVRTLDSAADTEVVLNGRPVLCLASNNYLGLATHPDVTAAAAEAAARFGAGSGAARLITGGQRAHDDLEAALADFKGTDEAVLFSSGYLANLGTIAAIVRPGDAVFSDELNHASIVDGARLSKAKVHVYRHADAGHLDDLLGAWRQERPTERALVVTDSVFSMDGDLAPLPDLVEVTEAHGAILMIDEAHATGVVGPGGRGAAAHFGLEGRIPVVMGTLSKALGAAGGFVAGRADLCAWLRNRARSFIFDTAMAPPVVAAAAAALEVVRREPERPERVRTLARRLADDLADAGYKVAAPDAAVIPVFIGEAADTMSLAAGLLEAGVLVGAIRPPSVAPGTSRLRVTLMATHTEDHLGRATAAFRGVLRA